ncbi:MAG TPA: hypothetical protein VFV87_07825 [Pirellulaceae bacterium]|nr:hypothetical protein [Pirellulaceae bacterium]
MSRAERPYASVHGKAVAEESLANGYKLEHPTLLFEDRMAFDDGERRVELIRVGPGHTIGDAVAYLPKEKILAVGDLCVNWTSGNNTGDRDADLDNWVTVLGKLAEWDAKTIVPGQGKLGTADTLRGQQAYLTELVSKVRAGVRNGNTADQLAQGIDLSRHQPWGANAASNANAVRSVYRRLAGQGK